MALGSEIRAGAAFVELRSKDNGFTRGLRNARRHLDSFGAAARKVGVGLMTGGGSIVAAGAAATRVFAKMGDQLDKMSKRTGLSSESLSALGFAAEQSGADIEMLEKGIRTMQRSIVDAGRGLSTQVDALKMLGLEYRDLKDLSPEDQFMLLADRISQVSDPTTRAALSMQLLGRAGQKLVPLLSEGSQGIHKLMEQARDLGLVISTDAASSAAELTDTLNITKRVAKAAAFEVGAALAPSIIKAANAVTTVVAGGTRWVKQNQELVATVFKVAAVVVGAGAAFIGVGLAATIASIAIGGVLSIMGAAGTIVAVLGAGLAALLSPIGLVITGVVGLGAMILSQATNIGGVVDTLVSVFKGMAADIFGVLGSITDAVIAGDLELAVKIAGKGMQLAWAATLQGMRGQWIDFKTWVSKKILDLTMDDSKGKSIIFGLLDSGADAEKDSLEDEIRKLTDELKELQKRSPDSSIGSKFRDFFDTFQGFDPSNSGVSRSVRGTFEGSALRTLASPTESSIESNTKKTAKATQAMQRYLERGGGGMRFA